MSSPRTQRKLPALLPIALLSLLALIAGIAIVAAPARSIAEAQAGGPRAEAGSATALPGDAATKPKETVFSLAVKGGWVMVPIGLCSVIALTIALERLLSLRKARVLPIHLTNALFEALPDRNAAGSEALLDARATLIGSESIVGRVLAAGVERLRRDEAHAQAALEESALHEAHLLRRRLRPFSAIASLSPLLGLLGTILGMIRCFENASSADAASRATTLSTGIYEALVTTAAGLCVAIPTLVILHLFQGKVDRVLDTVEDTATLFLDRYYGPGREEAAKP